MQRLLNENPSQMQKKLAELGIDRAIVSRQLHEKGKIQKLGK